MAIDPRKFLVNFSTRTVHLNNPTKSTCRPEKGDNLGYSDFVGVLKEQRLNPCAFCMPNGYPGVTE